MIREFRSVKVRELRAEQAADGKRYLGGYAANYNVLSDDLGWGMRERIMPGAFARAVKEDQDVRHLINHDPSLVLGRTKAKTTELREDAKGLRFRTLLPATSYASDLFESVGRGDIDECSFGFEAVRTAWIEEPDPEDEKHARCIRELHDVNLFDISTVTYPAYPGTNTDVERSARSLRAMFPDGVPVEIRSRMTRDVAEPCMCECPECLDGDCAECSNADCTDENCLHAEGRSAKPKTKRVDGEDLGAACFLIVGSPDDTRSWKLPWKFTDAEKQKTHLRNCLIRFNQTADVADDARAAAWARLVKLAQEHQVDVSDAELRSHLTPEQIYDFEKEALLIAASARVRAIQASL